MNTESHRRQICRLAIFWLIALLAVLAQAQTENPAPQIEILKLKWERQAKLPQDFDPSNGGASGTINDPTRSSRGGSGGGGGSDSSGSTTQGLQPSGPSRVMFSYVYSMKVQNHGAKEIEGVAWDYIFLDPSTSAEVGRHQFLSFEPVAPGKSATFHSEQRTPPVRTLSADANKKLGEKPIIRCVLYADGTTWREEHTSEDVCNLLRKGKAALGHKRSA
ncbi:MAG TPA: hypothetical protein VN696_01090 [Pyrinomonadaceae bacterium]|nr:hypothetical protein [Pyrinomonadaceae bacterium]